MKDPEGRTLGEHRGLHLYTKGQRQGLNLGGVRGRAERPWYVLDKEPHSNSLIITQNENQLMGQWLRADDVNWLREVTLPCRLQAKIRYRQSDQACRVSAAADGSVLVVFDENQRAITAGQFVAFYDGDEMVGGARIKTSEPTTATSSL